MNDSHNHDKCSIVKSDSGTAMDSNNGCSYFTFLDWLVEFCCHQLFPGASFSRRSTVLSMLSLIFSYKLYDPDIFSKKMAHRLLYVLQADTYEENKKLAKEIIQQLNFDLLGLDVSMFFVMCILLYDIIYSFYIDLYIKMVSI